MKLNTSKALASGIFAGGMLFSGAANAANVVVNSNFDDTAGSNTASTNAWGVYRPYAQTYPGVSGPDLNTVTTVDYGFNDDISLNAGGTYHGLEQDGGGANITSQTGISLISADVTAGQIAAGQGRFSFSGWLQTCCSDEPALVLQFNDALNTQVVLDRTSATNRITTADREVNPGGADNATSDTDVGYWAFYEFKGSIPTDATTADVTIRLADSATLGSQGDFGADLVILDTVAIPEPSSTALLGLGGLALILRRRK